MHKGFRVLVIRECIQACPSSGNGDPIANAALPAGSFMPTSTKLVKCSRHTEDHDLRHTSGQLAKPSASCHQLQGMDATSRLDHMRAEFDGFQCGAQQNDARWTPAESRINLQHKVVRCRGHVQAAD